MIIKKILFFFFIMSVLANVQATTNSVPTVNFNIADKKLDLQPYIEILPDPDRSLTIEKVVAIKNNHAFKTMSETGNSFGFTQSAFWLRFTLHFDHVVDDSILLHLEYPLFDNVTLYIPDGEGGFNEKVTGDALLFSTRDVNHRSFVFRLPEHGAEERTYYMRLQTEGSTQIVLSLWSATAFLEDIDTENFILGIYYGIMLLLMVAALAAFIKIRDRLFLYYALYLFTYILFQLSLNGFSYQYFWPEMPWFTSRATAALVGLVVVAAVVFSGSFLLIWDNKHPRIKRLFYVVFALGTVGTLLSLFGNYAIAVQLASASGLLLPPVAVIGAISSILTGYRPARFFLAAWGIFAAGIFVTGLLYVGVLPNNFFTSYSIQIGSTLEVMLLGYALMDRIELLNIEKENALEKASSYIAQLNNGLESQVDERTKQLSESEAQLRTLLETLPDLVWWKDPDGIYLACNSKVERFLGASQAEIVGKTDYDFVSRDLADFFRTTDKDTLSAGKACRYEEKITFADDGHKELLETVKTPIYSSAGEIKGVLGVGRDITERKRSEQALLYTQKMEAVDQLTGGIAHDFNNILAIITGNLSMLGPQLVSDEKASKRLATIKKAVQRATDLTSQLVSFTQKKPEQQIVTDINQLINEMDSLIAHSVTPAIEVKYELEKELWLTKIDPGDFQDAVINLVINARDAMSGSGHLVLQTSNCLLDDNFCSHNPSMVAGEYVKLSVIDNGKGISDAQKVRIFEPFYTTKKMGKGTGLGLSMVFGFIKRSNGCILVDSEVDKGTAFNFYLPRSYDEIEDIEVLDEKIDLLHRGQETILVVDDEEALLELTADVLEALGYRVLTANNGQQALSILAEKPDVDLLISDVLMPGGINGYELAESATASHPELKVLLASGFNSNVNVHNSQVRFSTNMLKKPYDLSVMSGRVRELLDL
jgi:PAS domain S-box-containing protein